MVRERRRYYRHELEVPVQIALPDGGKQQFTSTNLSEGGMAVNGGMKLPTQAQVIVTFMLPNGRRVESKGSVSWSTENGRAGIRFDLRDAVQREISAFLNKLYEAKAARSPALAISSRTFATA
jgi:hypothetical protein